MTDTITPAAATEADTLGITFPQPQPRPAMIGELARAHAAEQAALARVAQLEAEVQRLRTEQITDGGDHRLVEFWDKAGRIADHAGFCEEYDRLADALNGVPREREWDVAIDVTVNLRVYRTVTARDADSAIVAAEEIVDRDDIAEAIRLNGWDDITFDGGEAERA